MSQIKNDNIFVRAPKPVDGRTTLNTGALYATVADFLADGAVTPYRFISMTVPFVIAGEQVEYWFVGGIEDSDFQLKSVDGSIPNLQQVTDGTGNNITPNVITVNGLINFNPSTNGIHLLYDETEAGLINVVSGNPTGTLQLTPTKTAINYRNPDGSLNFISLQVESLSDAGATINTRLAIQDATQNNEATTLSQVTALIPSLTGYELLANKSINLTSPNDTKYPTTLAVSTAIGTGSTIGADTTGNSATTTAMKVAGSSSTILATNLGSSAVRLNATDSKVVDITGNSETVTNGVYTNVSYSNPSWITSLAYSKLTGAPSLSGYELLANKQNSLATDGTGVKYPTVDAINTGLTLYQLLSEKAVAGGYASLDGSGRVPLSQLPTGTQIYVGTWNASTNTPTLADGIGTLGQYYIVNAPGTQNLGSGSVTYALGDNVIYNGSIWEKVANSGGVTSVNSMTGAVSLTTANIPEVTNLYYTEARVNANTNVAANTAARHPAVTLGTANGLSLSTQALSLALASTSTNGALSSTDWNTFNNKQPAGSYQPQLSGTGFVKVSGTTISYDNSTYLTSAVTSVTSANSNITVANTTTTPVLTLASTISSNTTGNAATSTLSDNSSKWNNEIYSTSGSLNADYFMVNDGAAWKSRPIADVKTSLGIPSSYNYLPLTGGTLTGGLTGTTGTFSGNVTASTAPTLGGHLTNKTYVDGLVSGFELLSNKSTSTSLGTSNTLYPTQNAVKTYVDGLAVNYVNTTGNQTGIAGNKGWTGNQSVTGSVTASTKVQGYEVVAGGFFRTFTGYSQLNEYTDVTIPSDNIEGSKFTLSTRRPSISSNALFTSELTANLASTGGWKIQLPNASGVLALALSNVTSSAGSLTISSPGYYTFTGTTSTWTMPSIASSVGYFIRVINQGSGSVTMTAGTNEFWDGGASSTTFPVISTLTVAFYNNGTNWTVIN